MAPTTPLVADHRLSGIDSTLQHPTIATLPLPAPLPTTGQLSMAEEQVQRRLAAVLAADVVGYSRLMEADEVTALYEGAPKIQLYSRATRPLMPRSNLDRSRVALGRIRKDPVGYGLHLWAACDPLRLVASNAVELIATMLDDGHLLQG